MTDTAVQGDVEVTSTPATKTNVATAPKAPAEAKVAQPAPSTPSVRPQPAAPIGQADPVVPKEAAFETWETTSESSISLKFIGEYGRTNRQRFQGAGQRFHMMPEERRMNQNGVVLPEFDPFLNGMLRPIVLIETDPDYEKLMSNPNVFTEVGMDDLFDLESETFQDRIDTITNAAVVNGLIEQALKPETRAFVDQYMRLQDKQLELTSIPVTVQGEAPDDGGERQPTPRRLG